MRAITLGPAVELRHRKISARLAQDLVGRSKLPFKGLQVLSHLSWNDGAVDLGLLDPVMKPILAAIDATAAQREECTSRDAGPSEPRGPGPQAKTCSSYCLSWLHLLSGGGASGKAGWFTDPSQ